MKWTTEARIQRILSQLPFGRRVYFLGQRLRGNLTNFDRYADQKVEQGLSLLDALCQVGNDLKGQQTVELGTGVTPIVPILLWLFGQGGCLTLDVNRLLSHSMIVQAGRYLAQWGVNLQTDAISIFPLIALKDEESIRRRLDPERLRELQSLITRGVSGHELLGACDLSYASPVDTTNTGLPNEWANVLYSNVVLEHVHAEDLPLLMKEAYRLLKPQGLMVHQIDLSDHFSHSDPQVSPIHFLRFTSEQFSNYNNDILYQNRLRVSSYIGACVASGFTILHLDTEVGESALQAIGRIPIDEEFAAMSVEELCTTKLRLVAQRLPG